jgi:hypothetical protein
MVGVHFTRLIMKAGGLHPERLALEWASAAEGPRYVRLITAFTEKIRRLGPFGTESGHSPENLSLALDVARKAVSGRKLRTRLAKATRVCRESSAYDSAALDEIFGKTVDAAISREIKNEQEKTALGETQD